MKRSAPPTPPPRPGLQSLPPLPTGYWSRRESCGGGTHLPHPLHYAGCCKGHATLCVQRAQSRTLRPRLCFCGV